jgi:hypothetical protein
MVVAVPQEINVVGQVPIIVVAATVVIVVRKVF